MYVLYVYVYQSRRLLPRFHPSPFLSPFVAPCRAARGRARTHICTGHPTYLLPSFLPSFPSTYLSYPPSHSYARHIARFSSFLVFFPLLLYITLPCSLFPSLSFSRVHRILPSSFLFPGLTRHENAQARCTRKLCVLAVSWLPVHIVLTRIYIHAVQSCASMCIESVNATSVYMGREKAGIRSCTTIHSVCRR